MIRKILFILTDAISFVLYLLLFFWKSDRNVTLLYHSVGHINPAEDCYDLSIPPKNFESHLEFISRYKKKIVITFDDGYGDNFGYALSLLKKFNLSATFFLITDFINGKLGPERFYGKGFKGRALTWDEIRAMDRSGMKFGSHSKTHRFLSNISKENMKSELSDSKKCIEEALGHSVESFAYPFGSASSFNDFTKEALKMSGYTHAYTNIMGENTPSDDKYALRRIRIYRNDGLFKLRMKIRGAYDWVDVCKEKLKAGIPILRKLP